MQRRLLASRARFFPVLTSFLRPCRTVPTRVAMPPSSALSSASSTPIRASPSSASPRVSLSCLPTANANAGARICILAALGPPYAFPAPRRDLPGSESQLRLAVYGDSRPRPRPLAPPRVPQPQSPSARSRLHLHPPRRAPVSFHLFSSPVFEHTSE
ncbi:hypothetical protein B0H15DRAFT_168685 [Mycena belliarum]|uniref:Uncharacterized protein n=1 Tax=Mycena belliarum TaxID=1033014 RepID=A0AAD6U7S8_9AGAR|nr:hypothetical protein B0H15DRAFT_168685 [Mycena belliae]